MVGFAPMTSADAGSTSQASSAGPSQSLPIAARNSPSQMITRVASPSATRPMGPAGSTSAPIDSSGIRRASSDLNVGRLESTIGRPAAALEHPARGHDRGIPAAVRGNGRRLADQIPADAAPTTIAGARGRTQTIDPSGPQASPPDQPAEANADDDDDDRVGERVVVVVREAGDDRGQPGCGDGNATTVHATPSASQRTADALARAAIGSRSRAIHARSTSPTTSAAARAAAIGASVTRPASGQLNDAQARRSARARRRSVPPARAAAAGSRTRPRSSSPPLPISWIASGT